MAKKNEEAAVETEETKETVENEAAQEQPVKEKKTKKKNDAQAKLEQAEAKLGEAKDQMLRLAAEYDNFRKRSQKEKEGLYASGKSDVLKEFLPVLDNFERAAANKDAGAEDYQKGMDMIFKQFCDVFTKLGAESYGEVGDAFDPDLHNAVMHIEDENLPENTISAVFAKGMKIGDKVVRFAMVQVAN